MSPSSACADLPQLLHQLTRLKASLCEDLDASLLFEHSIPLTTFQAISELSDRREGCHQAELSAALWMATEEFDALVETLVASGYARRSAATAEGAGSIVAPTLRGEALLSRASRTVDRELDRRIGSVLSPQELAQLERALKALGSTLR